MRFTFTFYIGRKTITLSLGVKSKNRTPQVKSSTHCTRANFVLQYKYPIKSKGTKKL